MKINCDFEVQLMQLTARRHYQPVDFNPILHIPVEMIFAQLLKSQVDIDWANTDSGSGQKYNSILSGFHNEKKWIDYKNAAKIQTEKEEENEAAKEVTAPSTDGDTGSGVVVNPAIDLVSIAN